MKARTPMKNKNRSAGSKMIEVVKANGEREIYREKKLADSLKKAGASDAFTERILREIDDLLYDGISTREIYRKAFRLLKSHSRAMASRYELKKSIMALGPAGYPFEKFIGELLRSQGFRVRTGVLVEGHCVTHEIDVIAEKNSEQRMIECKFHQQAGNICNVKIPLYIQSRFLDIKKKWEEQDGPGEKHYEGWVVNNTRFSEDAIQYARCVGLQLLSWDYPPENGLKKQISYSGLYPVTCLASLRKSEKKELLHRDLVLCRQLCEKPEILREIGISEARSRNILDDAEALCLAMEG